MWCTYSTNYTKGLGINTKCTPTSFYQRRLSRLCIYSVEKHLGDAVEDMYQGYKTEMTSQTHMGVNICPYYNNMTVT
jgi:hypothetical protein